MTRGGVPERLARGVCPRGCGAEVLIGEDRVVFDAEPRWVLEHPHSYLQGWRPYSGFPERDGSIRVVQRSQVWTEHRCLTCGPLVSVQLDAGAVEAHSADAPPAPGVGDGDGHPAAAADRDGGHEVSFDGPGRRGDS